MSHSFAQGDRLRVELYIDSGSADRNAEIFDHYAGRRAEVEAAYGAPLSWEELPNRRACRVADYKDGCRVTDVERHNEFTQWFLTAGASLRLAILSVPPAPG
jgi:hypothetical protein